MHRIRNYQSVLMALFVLVLLSCRAAHAQYTYSAFAEGSVAYVALSGLGINFAAANPATLNDIANGNRFAYILEATDGNIDETFENDLPDFALQMAIMQRLSIALAQSERALFSEASAFRAGGDDPFGQHPLRFLAFVYQQNWSVGVGYRFNSGVGMGVSMRHESYAVFPWTLAAFPAGQNFRTFDLGFRKSDKRLNWGVVLRNFLKDRTTTPYSEPITLVTGDGSRILWHPTQFPGISFEPKFAVEAGIHWVVSSHWQLLGDVSSRKEYALGLRWRVFSKFFFTAGSGKRFDRIYTDEAVKYGALGAQFQDQRFAVAVTWIIPARSGRNRIVQTSYGNYDLRQLTNHQLLIGVAFSL